MLKNDWTLSEIQALYSRPLLSLLQEAATVHQQYHNSAEVQVCVLLSIKTGGCTEDCVYCAQSARYNTDLTVQSLMKVEDVMAKAIEAKKRGATRFCMGAAWREVRNNRHFEDILAMVRGIRHLGLEVCCTLGMLSLSQAQELKKAGLHSYNHNIDTSEEFYKDIVTTHTYAERLKTLENIRNAGIHVCCGGIIGLGEHPKDRIAMLHTLATLPSHPDSVPINALVPIKGTPLATNPFVDIWDMVRMISLARILMPKAMIRIAAGRESMSLTEQTLCFVAGANSIFAGEKLLTTPNKDQSEDLKLFEILGIKGISANLDN